MLELFFYPFYSMFSLYLCCISFILVCFRVLGLKLLPPLINLLFFPPFSLLFLFGTLLLFSEDYLNRIVDKVRYAAISLCGLKKVPLLVLLSFFFINTGTTASLVSIKAFLSVSMIVGNFIDVYLFGLIAVLMNWLLYCWSIGLLLCSFLLFLFLTRLELFLLVLSLLESFSSFFQSLTLANRLSINLLAGSLLTSLLIIAVIAFIKDHNIIGTLILFLLFIVFSFEILNSSIQLFIFSLLFLSSSSFFGFFLTLFLWLLFFLNSLMDLR